MRSVRWVAAFVVSLLWGSSAWAYDLQARFDNGAFGSCASKMVIGIGGTAASLGAAWNAAETCTGDFSFVGGTVPSNGANQAAGAWVWARISPANNFGFSSSLWRFRCLSTDPWQSWTNWSTNGPGSCEPPPPTCEIPAGTVWPSWGSWSEGDPYYATMCLDNCVHTNHQFSMGGVDTFGVEKYVSTGAYCSTDDESSSWMSYESVPTSDPLGEFEGACNSSGHCVVRDSDNCGLVNGEVRCFADIPSDGCVLTDSGAAFCVGDGAPDVGSAGSAATPNVTITQTQGGDTEINYFNSSVVDNSTNYGGGADVDEPQGDDPDAPGAGGGIGDEGGTCDPMTEECGDQRGTSSGDCGVPPSCSDAGSVECAILRQQWRDTCRVFSLSGVSEQDVRAAAGVAPTDAQAAAGLRQSVNVGTALGLPAVPGMSAAECPALPSFSFYGATYEVDTELICDFLRYIGLFVVVVSSLLSLRIAFGGN